MMRKVNSNTPKPRFFGVVEFEYVVSDGELNSDQQKYLLELMKPPRGLLRDMLSMRIQF